MPFIEVTDAESGFKYLLNLKQVFSIRPLSEEQDKESPFSEAKSEVFFTPNKDFDEVPAFIRESYEEIKSYLTGETDGEA